MEKMICLTLPFVFLYLYMVSFVWIVIFLSTTVGTFLFSLLAYSGFKVGG